MENEKDESDTRAPLPATVHLFGETEEEREELARLIHAEDERIFPCAPHEDNSFKALPYIDKAFYRMAVERLLVLIRSKSTIRAVTTS
jgi:hypothetical protein